MVGACKSFNMDRARCPVNRQAGSLPYVAAGILPGLARQVRILIRRKGLPESMKT
jgi:hypothetical protein